jgi:4-oxalmesaconate hydratase
MGRAAGKIAKDAPSFDEILKRFWFDTVVHNKGSLELLFDVVGADRCCFGTERPGSGGGIDPLTGRPMDDLKPAIESIATLSDADRRGVFEDNARRLFNRLDL